MPGTREARKLPYPRLGVVFLNVTIGNAVAAGDRGWTIPLSSLKAALRDGAAEPTTSDPLLTLTLTGGPLKGPSGFNPATDDISLAGINIVTPIELSITSILINGFALGVGADAGFAAPGVNLFAEVLAINSVSNTVQKLANAPVPEQIPIEGDISGFASNTVATTGVRQALLNFVFWITPRKDLK